MDHILPIYLREIYAYYVHTIYVLLFYLGETHLFRHVYPVSYSSTVIQSSTYEPVLTMVIHNMHTACDKRYHLASKWLSTQCLTSDKARDTVANYHTVAATCTMHKSVYMYIHVVLCTHRLSVHTCITLTSSCTSKWNNGPDFPLALVMIKS
jgi:hypothetical protein